MFQDCFHLQSHLELGHLQPELCSVLQYPLLSTMESRVCHDIRFKEQKNDKNRLIGNSGVSLIEKEYLVLKFLKLEENLIF